MSTKKFGIVAGLVFALSIVLSPAASACSLQDLQSCDNDGLMALVVQLLAGQTTTTTTTTTTPTITGIPAGFQFNTNLKQGSTGDDVRYLQIFLNSDSATAVGNAGSETSYFGPMTKAAVIKFQNKYASEVLAPYGLSQGTGFFGTSSRAKANAMLGSTTTPVTTLPEGCTSTSGFSPVTGQRCDSGVTVTLPEGCTSTSGFSPVTGQRCDSGTTTPSTPVSGNFTVSLASTSPASGTLITGQATANLAEYTFSNGTANPVKVTNVTLDRIGISADSTLDNVYLFDGAVRLTDAASVSSGSVTFNNPNGIFTVPANSTKTISVKSDIDEGTAGQTVGVSLSAITADGTLSSSLPIAGNLHTIASANLATYTISSIAPNGGDVEPTNDVVVWQVSFNPTKKVELSKLALRQISSIQPNDVQNFRLYVSGKEVAQVGSLDVNNMVTFLFNETIESTVTLQVKADIKGGSGRTIQMSLRNPSDITAKDAEFNVNISKGTSGENFPVNGGSLDVLEGSVVVKKSASSPSSYVSLNASNQLLAKYEMEAYGESVKIDTLTVGLIIDDGDGGTTDAVNLRNGRILIDGVQYGALTTLTESSDVPFNVNYVLQPGKVVTVEVRADIRAASGTAIDGNDTVTASLVVGASNAMAQTSYQSINVPSTTLDGNPLSVSEGTMTVTAKSSYPDQNVVFPQEEYKIGHYTISGSSVEAVDVYDYTVEVTVTDTNAKTSVRNVYLKVDGVNTPIKTNSTGAGTTGTYSFSTNDALAKNGVIEVEVYADINTIGVPNGSANVATTLEATGTGVESGKTITSNKATGQTINYEVASISVTRDASTPSAAIVAGGNGKEIKTVSYKFEAQNDSYKINRLSFSIGNATAVSLVKLMKGDTVLGTMSGDTTVTFAGINYPVASNTSEVLDVVLVLSDIGTGAGQTGADVTTQLMNDSDPTSSTRVKVIPSSTGVVGNIADGAITAGNEIRVYKSIPTISLASLPTEKLTIGTKTLQRFTISADAAGPVSWNQLTFTIDKTATALFSDVELYDGSTKIDGTFVEAGGDITTDLSDVGGAGTATTGTLTFVPTSEQQIPVGETKTYELKAIVAGTTYSDDYIMSRIASDAMNTSADPDGDSTYSDNVTGGTDGDSTATLIWSDMSAQGHATGSGGTVDWTNGYLVKNLPLDTQALTGTGARPAA